MNHTLQQYNLMVAVEYQPLACLSCPTPPTSKSHQKAPPGRGPVAAIFYGLAHCGTHAGSPTFVRMKYQQWQMKELGLGLIVDCPYITLTRMNGFVRPSNFWEFRGNHRMSPVPPRPAPRLDEGTLSLKCLNAITVEHLHPPMIALVVQGHDSEKLCRIHITCNRQPMPAQQA